MHDNPVKIFLLLFSTQLLAGMLVVVLAHLVVEPTDRQELIRAFKSGLRGLIRSSWR